MNGLSMNHRFCIIHRPILVVACLFFYGWPFWFTVTFALAPEILVNSQFGREIDAALGVPLHMHSLSNGLSGEPIPYEDEGFVLITGDGELPARDFTVPSVSLRRELDLQILDVRLEHAGWQAELQHGLADGQSSDTRLLTLRHFGESPTIPSVFGTARCMPKMSVGWKLQ